jgi:hypothetical protein
MPNAKQKPCAEHYRQDPKVLWRAQHLEQIVLYLCARRAAGITVYASSADLLAKLRDLSSGQTVDLPENVVTAIRAALQKGKTSFGMSTLKKWVRAYDTHGLDGLMYAPGAPIKQRAERLDVTQLRPGVLKIVHRMEG